MNRSIWTIDELARIIIATNEANAAADFVAQAGTSAQDRALARAYGEGFRAALTCLALAVGVPIGPRGAHSETQGFTSAGAIESR